MPRHTQRKKTVAHIAVQERVSSQKFRYSLNSLPTELLYHIMVMLGSEYHNITQISRKFLILVEKPTFFWTKNKKSFLREITLHKTQLQSELAALRKFYYSLMLNKFIKLENTVILSSLAAMATFLTWSFSQGNAYVDKIAGICDSMQNLWVNNNTTYLSDRLMSVYSCNSMSIYNPICYSENSQLINNACDHLSPSISQQCQELFKDYCASNSYKSHYRIGFAITLTYIVGGIILLYWINQRSLTIDSYPEHMQRQLVTITPLLPNFNSNTAITHKHAISLINKSITVKQQALRICDVKYSLYESQIIRFFKPHTKKATHHSITIDDEQQSLLSNARRETPSNSFKISCNIL